MNKSCGVVLTRSSLLTDEGYGCEDVSAGGFVGLMDLYETNFIRLRKLIANIGELGSSAVSHVDGCMDLHLEVLERSRFTSTICLTYRYIDEDGLNSEPNLVCRVYHDAGLVEVLAGHLKHGRQHHDHLPAESARIKWKLNRFLYKWLGFCLHLGHRFDTD